MKYLKVFATAEEIQQIKEIAKLPCIMVGNVTPESPLKACHRIALSHGLPEIPGYYGRDLRTGEFVESD